MALQGGTDAPAADERAVPLDIDDVHMLLQVEQEQVQKRTFTNWINAQLSKRICPSLVQDLFSDLRDGDRLLDLLEVMSGQHLKREKGHGVFQQRGNVETALNFLKNKSIKLVNINIPDIIDGKPSIILGLIWTIILRCHIEELASTLSFGSRSSSLDSLSSVDSAPGTPVRGSPVPRRASPLHARFRLSAKKALLLWVQDQCQKVGSSVSVKDFKSSWRSGVAFHAILCSLRPDLVDFSLTETRSNLENLEEAFRIAQQDLGIPRLLEPEDIDVSNPDEKSIMTYVAQFLQYSNDMPSVDDDLEASPNQKVREMTCWLQRTYQELFDVWSSTEKDGYSRRYQAFQTFVGSFYEQRRPVIPMLSAMKRSTKLSKEQVALRQAWDNMEGRLHRYRTELDVALPAPLHTLAQWLQRMEAVLAEEQGDADDHANAARNVKDKQEQLKALMVDMSGHLDTLHLFHNTDDEGSSQIPAEKLDELKRRFTNTRVTAKYHGIKLEYLEHWHRVCELLNHLKSKLNTWRGPYGSQESVLSLLQDRDDTIEKQGLVSILKATLHKLKETASTYTGKAALSEDSGTVNRQVKEAESEAAVSTEEADTLRGTLDRVLAAWELYKHCLHQLQFFLGQSQAGNKQVPDNLSKWSSLQAQLNETGNFLIEITDSSTSSSLANELGKLNRRWADFIKQTKFAVPSQQVSSTVPCAQAAQRLVQEAGWTLREAMEVSSEALHAYRKRLQATVKKISALDLDLLSPSPGFSEETLQKLKHTLPEMRQALSEADKACGGLQKTASQLEGRLAELDHWSTEAMEVCEHLREWQHRGHLGPHPRAKSLLSRGLQLEAQMVTEGQDLQAFLEKLQENSTLPFLSVHALQGRVKHTAKKSKEIIEMLTPIGLKREGETEVDQPPPKVIVRAYNVPEPQAGTFHEYETHTSKPKKPSQKTQTQSQHQQNPGCSQHTFKTGIKSQVLSQADPQYQPHDQHSVLLRAEDIEIIQNLSKEVQMELQTEDQLLTGHPSQTRTRTSSEWPQQLSKSSVTLHRQHPASESKAKCQAVSVNPQQHYGLLAKAHSLPQSLETSHTHVKTPAQAQIQLHAQGDAQRHTQLAISPHTPQQAQALPKRLIPGIHQRQQGQGNAPNPRHVPGQSEVFSRAQAMAKSRMNKAKQHLNQHIEEVITIFSNRIISKEQARRKQGALRRLNPTVLDEFLGAVEALGAFCSEAQLQGLEKLSVSVRAQWEDVRSAIESFLPELWREVERRQTINVALVRHDNDTNTEIPACDPDQVCCEQACSLVVEPQERLDALSKLSDTLRSPASSSVTTTQLTECDGKLETVHYQVIPSSNIQPWQHREGALRREPELPADQTLSQAYSQAILHTDRVETKQTAERTVIHTVEKPEVGESLQEAHSSYTASRSAFKQQLQKNSEQLSADFFPGSCLSPVTMNKHLQDLQVLRQQTEVLWFEFELQSSSHMESGNRVETDRVELIEQWRGQQICLHARMRSLKCALELLEPTDIRIKRISDQLDQNVIKTLDITSFAPADLRTVYGDAELVGEHIQRELMLLSEMESKVAISAGLTETELQAQLPLQQIIQSCTQRLQLLNHRLAGTQSVLGALERFLSSLHQLNDEVSTADGTSPLTAAPDSTSRLASIREKLQHATAEAAQIDCMLQDAGMSVTLDKKPGSCQDLVARCAPKIKALERRGVQCSKEEEKRERVLRKKRKALQVTLNELQRSVERQSLKEPTLPALQHRLRCLSDMESKLAALHSDIQNLRDTSAQANTSEEGLRELEVQWEEIHNTLSESQEECLSLTELLRRFQSCRTHLNNTLQISEQTISEQASYIDKENLQRLISRVNSIKSDLSALGDGVEEFRAVCRQLHSQMRNIPDCPDAPFESEADALMDRWLDVSERTDCHFENLQIGLSLWDKLLLLAREVELWTNNKLRTFAQSYSFQTEQEVLDMQEELRKQEENVEHIHRRSAEIMEILHSSDPPLELQVTVSQLRKRMEEVKDLFTETSDVFRELADAKALLTARMTECMSSIQMLKDALSTCAASDGSQIIWDIQVLSEKLQLETEQADTLLHQVAMLANVASPESLLSLIEDGAQLQENISAIKHTIILKREEAENLNKTQQVKYAQVAELEDLHSQVTVQKVQDPPPKKHDVSNSQGQQGQSSSHTYPKAKELYEDVSDREHWLKDLENFRHLAEMTDEWLKRLQQSVDTQETDTQNIPAKTEERLQELQVVLNLRAEGDSRLEKLKVRGQSLLQRHSERGGRDLHDVLCTLGDAECLWDSVLQSAVNQYRLLQGIMEPFSSIQHQRQLEGQTALSQDVQTLLNKPTVFEKSLHKQLDHLQSQKARETGFEMVADNIEDGSERRDTRITPNQVSKMERRIQCSSSQSEHLLNIMKDMTDYGQSTELSGLPTGADHQHTTAAPKPVFNIVLQTELSTSIQESSLFDSVDSISQQNVTKPISFFAIHYDEATKKQEESVKHSNNITLEGMQSSSCTESIQTRNSLSPLKIPVGAESSAGDADVLSQQPSKLHMDSDKRSSTETAIVCKTVLDVDQLTLKPDGQQSVESPKAGDTNVLSSVSPTDNAIDSKSRTTKSEEDLVKSLDCVVEIQPTSLTESVQTGQPENAYSQHLQPPVCAGSSNGDADLSSQNALMLSVRHTTDMDVLQNQEVETISEIKARSVSYQKSPASPDQNQQQGPERAIPNDRNEPDIEQAKSEEVSIVFRQGSEHTQGEVDFSHAAVEEVHENTTTESDLSNQTPVATQPESRTLHMDSDNQSSTGIARVCKSILDVDQPTLKPDGQQSVESPKAGDTNVLSSVNPTDSATDSKSRTTKSEEDLVKSLDNPTNPNNQRQSITLTESMQTGQTDNAHSQQLQTPVCVEHYTGDTYLICPEPSKLSDRDIMDMDVLQSQELTAKSVSYQQHTVSVNQDREDRQETTNLDDKTEPDNEDSKSEHDYISRLGTDPAHTDTDISLCPVPEVLLSETDLSNEIPDANKFESKMPCMKSETESRPGTDKVCTIILDVDLPMLKLDGQEPMEFPKAGDASEFRSNSTANANYSKSGTTKSEEDLAQSLDSLVESQTENVSGEQDCMLLCKDITEVHVLHTEGVVTVEEHDVTSKIIRARKNYLGGEDWQESKNINEAHTELAKGGDNECLKLSSALKGKKKKKRSSDSDQTNHEEKSTTETSSSKQMSEGSFLHHQSTTTRHAPDTTLSTSTEYIQKDTSKSMNVFSLDGKAVDAVAISNDLDSPENTDRQLSDTSTALVCTTHASDIGSHSTNIKSTDFKFTIEKQVPNSGEISETSRTETESTLQLEFSIHAKAGSKEQAEDPDSNDCLQPEEMSKTKTKVSGSEGVECEHFKDNSKKTRTANQPAQASALDTLLDISTNVHTVMDTCDVPSRDKPREVTSLLESPLTELENRLGRAVLRILKCRYQPAQLSTELLSKQLQEAESCRQYVGEQLASQSQWGGSGLSQVNQRMVERWNSAMLDATATVQVKEAQLQQVTKYHQQIQVLQDVLQELEEELDSLSLVSLESSAVQAKNLCAFLEHMKQKNSMLEELMTICCHMSPYLGEADGPVACLIQIKNLQKKWQILEWTAERSLRHANHCMSEVSILMMDAKALLVEVELLHTASSAPSTQIKDCQWAIHNMITFFQFVEINERYLYLHGLSQALFQCPLGEKEKEDISNVFQNLKAQLDCAQEKLCIDATCPRDHLLAEITDTMKSWFSWATQTESTITRKKRLSLFPEEATQQVNSMKKLQSEISSRQLKLPSVVMKIKQEIAGLSQVESSLMLSALQTLENIYSKISEKSERVTADLNQMLHARQRLDMQITDNSTWLASLFENESNKAAAILLGSSITDLRVYHQKHKATLKEAEKRLSAIQTLLDNTKDMIPDLSIVDSFHLINRLTTLQEEMNGVVKCKRTTCWELEEILHAQESSTEEFATIQKSLRQIKTDLEKQRYPVTRDSLAAFDPIRRMLIEHLSQVLEVPHCKENQRKELLRTILNLQENMRTLDWQSMEHEEYLTSKKHLQSHFEAVKMRVLEMSDSSRNTDKRLLMAQTLLVKIPLVRISCQKTAEQLEAISGDLFPSQLNSERQKIRSMLQSLTAWESIVSTDVKNQEDTLFTSSLNNLRDLTPLTEHFMRVEELLKQNTCLDPSDQAITIALQTCLTLERSVASGLRILESCIDCTAIEGHGKTTNIGRRILKDCKMQLENLLEAKEALKEYHSAVRRAVGFLQQIETKLLLPSASFKDSKEELNYSEQLNTSLAKGFQDHMNELQAILPSQACFSPQTKKLHIQVVSYLHVTDAKLEAQAQLKLDALQRYLMEQATYTKQHDDMNCLLQNFDFQLSDSFSHKPISVDECKDQLEKINVLQEELVNVGRRLEELKDKCPLLNCNVGAEKTLGHLQSHWALLQQRLDTLKSRVAHTETQWKEIMLRTKRSRDALDHLQHSISEISKMKGSLGKLQEILGQTEQLQNELDQERLILVSLQRHVSRLLNASNLHNTPSQISQELQSLLSRCRNLREQSSEVRHDLLSEIQECGRSQEELKGLQQSVLSLLSVLQGQSDPSHIREVRAEVDSQKVRLQDIMDRVRVRMRNNDPPQEIQNLYDQVTLSLKEIKDKVGQAMERSGSLQKMNEHVYKVTEGLSHVKALLQQKSPTVKEAESILKRVWDELDQWHSRITELEAEVQELAEEQPERAHILMDELTEPLQLYQAVAKQAEQRTAFINRIPTCLQEYEDILRNSTFWLAETQSWLKTAQTYTTAKCLHSHANSLQMVLDESEGMQRTLEAFGPSLQEISAVYDTSTEEQNLFQIRTNISHMQCSVLEPLSQLQHAAAEMDAIEAEVKTMEKSIMKIRSILSTVETEHITPEEHLLNRQVILENLQAMQRTLAEIERCRDGLGLPTGAELSLTVFHRAEQLHPHINELQQLTEGQSTAFRAAIGHSVDLISPTDGGMVSSLALHCSEDVMDPDESSLGEDPVETSVTTRVQVSVTKESLLGATERLVETKLESVTLPTQLQTISNTTNSRSADDDDTASVPVIAPEMLLPLTADPAVQLKIPTKETEDIKYTETTEMAEGVTPKNELQPQQIRTSAVKHGPVRKNNNVVDMSTESGIHEILTERVEQFRSRHTEEENIICVDHKAVETTVSTLDTDTVSLKDPDETPVDEASAETTASTVVQVPVTKDSPPKEIDKSVESVPLKTETKPENGTSSKRESVAKDAGPVSATVCPQYLDASIPLTTDPAVQLNIPTKITGKETEETLKDIKPALKPEQIGASTITPGLVSKDKEIVDMESDLQEMLEESKFKPIEKESAVSEDQQRAVSFLAAVPILDTNTTPLEDTMLQEVQNDLQEQRDLVEDIARQSSSSDLEQENQAQSQKPTGSIGGSLNVPQHPAEIEVTWVQLLPRLDLLLDSINTELDRTKLEVKSIAEDEVVSDAGSSITQEMNGHTKRLQLIHHKRLTLVTPAVIVLSELCEALTGLSHSLFRITHTLQSPSETIRETSQLHLLNDQCLSTQLASLSSMISSMGPEITASGVSDATSCLEQVSSCISSIQRALSSQMELLNRQLGHTPQLQIAEQLLESPVSVLEAKGAQHSKSTSFIRDLSSLQGVQGKVWSSMRTDKRTGQEVSALHRCYQANLQGLRDLLELGSERLQHSQVMHQHSCSQLQSLLRGHKRYFKELRWYHAMIQHLSKQIPEGPLQDQEEVEQLVSELVLQALGQEVHIQHNLEECARFEEMRVKLRRQLDELEAAMPSNDLNSQTETRLQDRLQAYQQLQRLHKDVRPQLELLQALVLFPERVNHTGPVSELQTNWLALHRQLEQEIQRTKEMQVNYDRFQCSSSELEVWMASALANVHMWNNLCDPNPQDSEFILPNIMNFFKELESRSVQKATAVRAGTQVLQLSDTEAPELRQHLFQLEQDWTELTNAAPSVQHTLQQLLAGIGQSEVRTYLSAWVEKMKSRLEEESSREHHALNSTELTMLLQHLMDCKAEMTSRKPCIDFLNHSVEETGFVDEAANRNQRLTLAEQLGALNLDWVLLQRKIDIKMREIEHKKQDCAQREGLLQRLRSWISVQEKKMRVNERPAGWTQIQQALKDSEEEEEEQFNLKSTELLHLRTLNMLGLKDGQHPGDQTFSSQVESTSEQFQTLRQQMSAVRAALVRLNEQWVQLDAALRDAALHTVSMTYKLECSKIPTLSLQQSKEHVHQLQELQMEGEQSEQTWTNLASLFLELKDRIHPAAAVLLSNEFDQGKARWAAVVREVSLELQKAQMELRLWQEYRLLYEGCSEHLTHYWEQCEAFLSLPKKQEYNIELLQSRINNISEFEDKLEALRANVGNVIEASKLLIVQLEPQAAPVIQSESRLLSRDLVHLSEALVKTREQLQEELEDHVCFSTDLGSLMQCLKRSESVLASPMSSIEHLKLALLELSSLTPALGALNQQSLRLALTPSEAEQLQVLNTHWVQVFTKEMNRHREMYSAQLCDQSFQQKYQAWMILLEKLESGLSSGISGNDFSVREQLAVHQKLKMEVLIGQQLLDAVVSEELARLDESQVEDRKDQRLTQLKERWQGTLSRVQQRSRCLEQQTEQWSLYRTGLKRLWRLLKNLEPLLSPAGLAPCRFQQLQQSIQDYEQAQEKLSDHEELYTQTVQVYRQILPLADVQTQAELKAEIGALQEAWEQSNGLVVKRKALSETVIKSWSCCEDGLADSALHLREIAVRLQQLPPDNIELQEKLFKEDENSLELWAGRLKKLVAMKTDISQYVLPTDTVLLQGQLEELHSQWEELCLKVSKRKQEISDRLNAWTIFNDKHKELCEWLAQMERKVMHSSDYFSIEEMVEKLKKDCTEEMNLFNENKSHLKRLGEQLLLVSDQAKEANIHGVLQDVNDRWQHLFDQIGARVNKLKDTLAAVQQLDKNMSNLRSWLSRIEAELTKPVHYSTCNGDEIQKRLEEQQELQKDIVQHTEGITSVLTLCDMLLHDEDACSNNSENDSIQQTTHSLDQRWRNICSMSLERKIRTEETWRLWCKFQDDYSQFEDWLNVAEQTSAEPESADVLYTVAKEELKRYEAFQRDVQEKLAQLEMINSHYRRLARENRTDSANRLRTMVHQGNQRWDALHKRVAAILRRLRHFTAQRDDFEGTRENLLVWLTEMDLELTNVEHFTESDIEHKLKKLKGLKKKITQNTDKIDALIVFGEGLIQRSAPEDAALIEDELENLHSYCQEVFSRVGCFHQRLTSPQRLLDKPELCISESSAGMEDSNVTEQTHDTSTSQASMSLLVPPQERSGCETPLSVDSIPLEWDHTGDVCGSSSHEEDDDASFFSCLSGVQVKESSEAVVNYTVQSLTVTSAPGRDVEAQSWHSQAVPDKILFPLPDAKEHTPDLPKHESTPYKQGYVQLTSECSSSIKNVKKVSLILDDDELQEDQGGLTSLTAADKQSRVIERWELLQAQTVREEQCYSRDREQLTSDLHDITSWLDQVIPELEKLHNAETACVSVQIMEARVKHLKDMQKAFARYKTLMLSLNLGGRELKCETGPEVQQVQEDLCSMNQSWNKACTSLDEWEDNLRKSFMHCQEFHETLHSLLLWLAHAESRRFTVNIHDPSVLPSVLHEHRTALMGLEEELKARQGRVSSLQEITNELLPESGAEDDFEVTEKLHVIHKKLRLLLHQVKQDLQTVQERLDSSEALAASEGQDPGSSSTELTASRSSSATRTQNRDSSPPRSFFYRVLRAAFPLHVLFLLLLVFACLVPLSEEDYSCTLSNNFARSFYPMLRYTNGPPPT